MIRYALKCAKGHSFESWFQSADAFDALMDKGLVECPECGVHDVEKAVMAPRVGASRALSTPEGETQKALAEMRARIEAESDYVGEKFAAEARAMHLGDVPERSIYGEARPEEARALLEDGVPVLPLPFSPKRKVS